MNTYKLLEPVTLGSTPVTEINFRKPKAKDLRTLGTQLNVDELLKFAQIISDQPKFVFDEMGIPDAQAVMGLVSDFFAPGPQTGPTH
jgi:hypothetical protein